VSEKQKKTKESAQNTDKKTSLKREIIEWVVVIEIAVILAVVINLVFLVNAVIPSASMEPTIMTGDRIFGNRLAYTNEDPKRGDIVIFKFPDDESQLFIKRVIGEPGDIIWIKAGKVYINGSKEPLDEPYVKNPDNFDFGPYQVPENSYFMLGDNRAKSADSRYWNNPYVSKDKILGEAWFRYYPSPCLIGTSEE